MMKKFFYASLIGMLMMVTAVPAFAAEGNNGGTYILNSKGPSGSPVIDTSYNLGKDVAWTVLKLAFLPVEIFTEFIVKGIF